MLQIALFQGARLCVHSNSQSTKLKTCVICFCLYSSNNFNPNSLIDFMNSKRPLFKIVILLFTAFFISNFASCDEPTFYNVTGGTSGLAFLSNDTVTAVITIDRGPSETLTFSGNSFASSATKYEESLTYTVQVTSAPDGYTCAVTNTAALKVGRTRFAILCSTTAYDINIVTRGLLDGKEYTLNLTEQYELTLSANGRQSFSSSFPASITLAPEIASHPIGQICTLSSGNSSDEFDTISNLQITADTDIVVTCRVGHFLYNAINRNDSQNRFTGNFTRKQADNACATQVQFSQKVSRLDSQCDGTAAFISFSRNDQMADLPTSYSFNDELPVFFTPDNVSDYKYVANNWADLMDGTISFDVGTNPFWTGSDRTGQASNSCNGWRGQGNGYVAYTSGTSAFFNLARSCQSQYKIKCICYQDQNPEYSVGATVLGLESDESVTLLLEETSDTLTFTTNEASDYFASTFLSGETYTVSVQEQPDTGTCTVGDATGTIEGNTLLTVTCATEDSVTIGGIVSGLSGSVTLSLNSGEQTQTVTSDGSFTFSTSVDAGSSYAVSVSTNPDTQTCSVSNASGTASSSVTNITVTCTNLSRHIFFQSTSVYNANILDRSSVDDACETTQSTSFSSLTCSDIRGFISLGSIDQISDFPLNYDLDESFLLLNGSNNNAIVANNWDDLLDGTIDSSFDFDWFSGASSSGESDAMGDCSTFSSSNPASQLAKGLAGATNSDWIADTGNCGEELYLLCLCLDEGS